jgi:hypothetical protein
MRLKFFVRVNRELTDGTVASIEKVNRGGVCPLAGYDAHPLSLNVYTHTYLRENIRVEIERGNTQPPLAITSSRSSHPKHNLTESLIHFFERFSIPFS